MAKSIVPYMKVVVDRVDIIQSRLTQKRNRGGLPRRMEVDIIEGVKPINTNNTMKENSICPLGFNKRMVRMKLKENKVIDAKLAHT